ncbi:MAG: response regulator [Candidatus Tectomicrobia bacterium]|nr:response regulator [Candidatus Tectomicrobia bacterium]
MNTPLRLLLLDDNPDDRALVMRELRREFPDLQAEQITEAKGFAQALEVGNFDLVITDYQLRWTDGLTVLHAVKARWPDCPVIMFTGTNGEEIAVEAMKAGLNDYILKSPKHFARLSAAVQLALENIPEHKRAGEVLRQYAERLKILREITQAILGMQSSEAIAEAALRHIQQLLPCQLGSVVVFDSEAHEARVLATNVNGEIRVERGVRLPLEAFGMGEIEALRQGKVRLVEDILTLSELPPSVQILRTEKLRSSLRVPLIAQGELIGSFNLGSDNPGAFAPEQVDIALEVTDQLAVAIQQARLHEQVQRYTTELEQRVTERTAKLWETNAELESFSSSVSHDLRAPLRAMQGFTDALLEEYADRMDSVGQDYVQRIAAAARRMDAMIQDLLAYSRVSRIDLRLQLVGLTLVVAEALTQLAVELREREAQVTVEEPLPEVMGHRATLVQVVANLLTNAVKFVEPGVQPKVRIWAEEHKAWVRLWVEDNGIGIASEHQERIFRVFERLHGIETYPGTGIGLAIVRKGVDRMGGRVGVESVPGQGSRFWVELQRTEDSS